MATSLSADELLTRFETACSLGAESVKLLPISPDEARRLLEIFHESVREDDPSAVHVRKSITLLEKIASGKKVVLYDRTKMPQADQKAELLVTATLAEEHHVVEMRAEEGDWIRQSLETVRFRTFQKVNEAKIEQARATGDLTSVVYFQEELAKECERLGMHTKALEIRRHIAQLSLPEDHPLMDMPEALQQGSEDKPLPRMGAYFQSLDTGSVKMGTIHGAKRRVIQQDPSDSVEYVRDVFWFDLNLTHWARADLERTVQAIQEHPEEFEQAIGRRVHVRTLQGSMPAYDEAKGLFSIEKGWHENALSIEIEGIGSVFIYTNPHIHSFYNRMDIVLDEQYNQWPHGLRHLHSILSLLGLGTALFPSRHEDKERIKIFTLLHAFFPRLSYVMERDPENYRISIQELRSKISASEPAAAAILTKYLEEHSELFVKDELYPGRQTYVILDMGDQIRQHGCGLLFGTKCTVCSCLPWTRDSAEAKRQFEPIAAQYVAKLKEGVVMDSNREAYLCRGEQTGGSSPPTDAGVGGLDSVFTRLIPHAYDGKIDISESSIPFCYDGLRVLLDADVMGQASCYAHQTDRFGTRKDLRRTSPESPAYSQRWGLPEFALKMQQYGEKDADRKERGQRWQAESHTSAMQNEVMIRDLVPTRFVRGILVPRQEMKEVMIAEFRKAGLIENREGVECVVLPGCVKPIDEFIYVGNVPRKEMWAKPTRT